jgi:hypothetical protein
VDVACLYLDDSVAALARGMNVIRTNKLKDSFTQIHFQFLSRKTLLRSRRHSVQNLETENKCGAFFWLWAGVAEVSNLGDPIKLFCPKSRYDLAAPSMPHEFLLHVAALDVNEPIFLRARWQRMPFQF